MFFTGHSGAGKSSMIKLLFCEEFPTSGKVIVGNKNTKKLSHRQIPKYRRKIGIVFQDFRLIPNLNVYDNIAFAMRVVGKGHREIDKRVNSVLELVGLQDKAYEMPSTLSGGEQQRVAIARAIANGPDTIIADEPTGNLDPDRSREIMNLFKSINKRGITVVVVTHEQQFVEEFRKRTIVIEDGKLIRDIQYDRAAPEEPKPEPAKAPERPEEPEEEPAETPEEKPAEAPEKKAPEKLPEEEDEEEDEAENEEDEEEEEES